MKRTIIFVLTCSALGLAAGCNLTIAVTGLNFGGRTVHGYGENGGTAYSDLWADSETSDSGNPEVKLPLVP